MAQLRFDGLFKWPSHQGPAACRLRVIEKTPMGRLVIMTELPMSYPGAVTRGLDTLVPCIMKIFHLKDQDDAIWIDENSQDVECRFSRVRFAEDGDARQRTWLEFLPEGLVRMALEGEDSRPTVKA